MSETAGEAISRGARALKDAGVENAGRDAELLMRWAAGLTGAELSARLSDPLDEAALARFESGLATRAARAPLSHIVGGRVFWGRWFEVTQDVLDPRPETETMIAAALEGPDAPKVLDLGVGAGCLLGTYLAERPEAQGLAIDASRAALDVAKRNLHSLGVQPRARFALGDWLDGVEESFNLILCNPPYIGEAEIADLSPEVRDHEPRLALTPGGDGMDSYRRIAPELAAFLKKGGRALFEIGPTQCEAVSAIFGAFGWPEPIVHRDMDDRERCLEYRRK